MSIHYNQAGYDSRLPKKAVLTGNGELCMILDTRMNYRGDKKVWEPALSAPVFDTASGDTVRMADFSGLTEPGTYFLIADGQKVTITIKDKPWHELSKALVKGLYYQRCGCALEEKHAGPWKHGICHTGKAVLVQDNGELDRNTVIECTGGWHDAGDYGRYIHPAAAALGHMLYSWELFPQVYQDELGIPESGNGVPDILNECRYELEWMLKMQRADGGLYHKVATRYFAQFIMPEDDTDELWLFPVSHCATASFAASTAQAWRVYKNYDLPFAEKLLAASKRAWAWLEANPDFKPFVNPPNLNSGAYGDQSCEDEIFWAACELYAATGEKPYMAAMKRLADKVDVSQFGWRENGGFGALCCLFVMRNTLDADFTAALRARFLAGADHFLELGKKSGYGTALAPGNYIWGSILPIMNNGIALILAKLLTGDSAYQDAAQAQLDYLLGLNATGCSFVTGFGERSFRFPHHRPSYADGVDDPVPGLVSGGPNNISPDAAARMTIPPGTAPAKFWLDHTPTASSNEIAIYWNSPAVFAAAYFDSLSL
ncbi:MAG: glycoside hydrolase family 9 protein [Treponema sp.]|jgi:endoglucanase|nr:glycoside hydrolase family 9 protein [Treponema sp.]